MATCDCVVCEWSGDEDHLVLGLCPICGGRAHLADEGGARRPLLPAPSIVFEMPMPISERVRRTLRELQASFRFLLGTRAPAPRASERAMFSLALFDGFYGGHTVEREGSAFVQRRNPRFRRAILP